MTRKNWIASVVATTVSLTAVTPMAAHAGSPLLSGYGGPGAGEQAIVGSTLLGGARGGGGSGGSSGSSSSIPRSGGANTQGTSSGSETANGSTVLHGVEHTHGQRSGTASEPSRTGGSRPPIGRSGASQTGRAKAYVYPSTPASAQGDSSAIGISSGDALALIAIVATLGLIGVLTVRLSRLQP